MNPSYSSTTFNDYDSFCSPSFQLHCFETNLRISCNLSRTYAVSLPPEMPIGNNMSVAMSKPSTHILISKYYFPFKGSRTPWGSNRRAETKLKNSFSIN